MNIPPGVDKAKNLIEEFFGLAVLDGKTYPAMGLHAGGRPVVGSVQCFLASPTGKRIGEFCLHWDEEGQVSIQWASEQRWWEQPMQSAIGKYVNNQDVDGLGDFKPTAGKLEAARVR